MFLQDCGMYIIFALSVYHHVSAVSPRTDAYMFLNNPNRLELKSPFLLMLAIVEEKKLQKTKLYYFF